VDRRVAALYAARAERDALEANRLGDYAAARRIVERCIERIRRYAGDDGEILALLERLARRKIELAEPMDLLTRKFGYASSHATLKSRAPGGTAQARRTSAVIDVLVEPDLVPLVQPVMVHLAAADPQLFGSATLEPLPAPWVVRPGVRLTGRQEDGKLSKALRHAPPAAVHVLFTTAALYDNWFSHWHAAEQAAVVSMPGPGTAGDADPRAYVAYQVVQHGLRLLGPAWDPERLAHPESRGCVFDFCEHRPDIEAKLQAADLCPPCETALAAAGLPIARLRRLLEVIRTLAAPAVVVH
jgi:hypothetical protein